MIAEEKSNPIGINHISLEVGNIVEAVAFYASFLNVNVIYEDETSGISRDDLASIEMGDQFIALTRGDRRAVDKDRHFGLVVDDKDLVKRNLEKMGVELLPGPTMTFLDPWGNRIEIVTYSKILFAKSDAVLRSMGVGSLEKTDKARARMRKRGYLAGEDESETG